MAEAGEASPRSMAEALGALANPTRVALLRRLARPAFAADLARELGITRQGLKRHLDALAALGLVRAVPARRGFVPATQYRVDPTGLFRLREDVLGLEFLGDASAGTLPAARADEPGWRATAGLLLVHGDAPGRWFPLERGSAWVVGRDPRAEVSLGYDPFVSAQHATLRRADGAWTLTDHASRNGTRLNFRPLPPGLPARVRGGDVLTIGRSHLLFREAPPGEG